MVGERSIGHTRHELADRLNVVGILVIVRKTSTANYKAAPTARAARYRPSTHGCVRSRSVTVKRARPRVAAI
jgi:hypothetical protein